jgi:hypothetical protein
LAENRSVDDGLGFAMTKEIIDIIVGLRVIVMTVVIVEH